MKISELTDTQRDHLVWRLDHNTGMGLLTAIRVVKGQQGDLELTEVFKLAGQSDRSASILAGKVARFTL
jgi:hypothetical protein